MHLLTDMHMLPLPELHTEVDNCVQPQACADPKKSKSGWNEIMLNN